MIPCCCFFQTDVKNLQKVLEQGSTGSLENFETVIIVTQRCVLEPSKAV